MDWAGRGGMLVRETALVLVPAAAALLALVLLGEIGGVGLAGGLAVGLAVALAVGAIRMRHARAVADWLAGAARGETPIEPPRFGGPLGTVARPAQELVRALEAQRRAALDRERLFDTLIDALPDPIFLVDRARMVRRCNPAAARSFGAGGAGMPLGRLVRDPGVLAAIEGALEAGHGSGVAFNPPGERFKRFAARIEPIALADDEQGALVSLREQGAQVMIERIRSDFVANASHEMRTPLAAIQGIVETLRGPARDDPAARDAFLETMAQETARLTRLVDDLLLLSRIELAANQPPRGLVAPGEVLALVVESLAPLAARQKVALELECPRLPPVRGDADQLHQLFANLVDNAIKYGGEGKAVRIAARARAAAPANAGPLTGRACVEVAVSDQGEGIAPEHIPRLTERFFRVDTARSRRLGGTGLGLAIVKHILRRHQGHLLVTSVMGEGSTFRVFLPLAEGGDGSGHRHRTVAERS